MKKPLVALVVIVSLGVAHRYGVLSAFANPASIRETLIGLGPSGQLVFVVAYTLLQPFGIPGMVFCLAAPLVWPWPVAFALSMIGTMAASVVGFSFARFVGRDFFRDKVFARLARYEEALEKRAFATIFLLRFIFWMPQWLHALFGVSGVRFWTHFWASLVAYVLPVFLMSYFGQAFFAALRTIPTGAWLVSFAAIVLVAFAVLLVRKWRAKGAV